MQLSSEDVIAARSVLFVVEAAYLEWLKTSCKDKSCDRSDKL